MSRKSRRERRCVALRPTPQPGHVNCLPENCKRCFAFCENELLASEYAVCAQCLTAYVKHPSPVVRRAFVRSAIESNTLTIGEMAHFLDDTDTEVVLMTASWIREQRKERNFV